MNTNNSTSKQIKNWDNLFEIINSELLYLQIRKKEYKEHATWYVDYFYVDGSPVSHSTLKAFTRHLYNFTQGTIENYPYIKAHRSSSLSVDNLSQKEIEHYKETINDLLFNKNKVTEKCNITSQNI